MSAKGHSSGALTNARIQREVENSTGSDEAVNDVVVADTVSKKAARTPPQSAVPSSDSRSKESGVKCKKRTAVEDDDDAVSFFGSNFDAESGDPLLNLNKSGPQSDPTNLIVNYIPTPITDDELRRLFEPFGVVGSARIITDKANSHPKGYGFVKFTSEKAAAEAIKMMNGFEIGGKRLRVTRANGPRAGGAVDGAAQVAARSTTASPLRGTANGPPAPVMLPAGLSPGCHPFSSSAATLTLLPSAAPPLPQQVYFSANLVAGGYQLNPQPFTFAAAGNTVIAQPVPLHGSAPIIFLPPQHCNNMQIAADLANQQRFLFTQQQHQIAATAASSTPRAATPESSSAPTPAAAGTTAAHPLAFASLSATAPQTYPVGASTYSVFNSAATLEQCYSAATGGFVVGGSSFPSATFAPAH